MAMALCTMTALKTAALCNNWSTGLTALRSAETPRAPLSICSARLWTLSGGCDVDFHLLVTTVECVSHKLYRVQCGIAWEPLCARVSQAIRFWQKVQTLPTDIEDLRGRSDLCRIVWQRKMVWVLRITTSMDVENKMQNQERKDMLLEEILWRRERTVRELIHRHRKLFQKKKNRGRICRIAGICETTGTNGL